MALTEITESIIRDLATTSSYLRGIEYFENGEVDRVWIENGKYHAYVRGTELYKVTISGKKGNIRTTCSCPYDWEGVCKHVVAVMLTVLNEKKAEEHKTNLQEITKLIEDTEPGKIKEFLLNILSNDEPALKDFRIFIVGEKETNATTDTYKREILKLLETSGSREDYYDDDYYGDYDSPIDDILSDFTETAEKYNRQGNYREAIKIYQAICDACIEGLENEKLEDFYDDIHYEAGIALKHMAENIGKLKASLNKKKVHFDYLLKLYETFDDRESIKHAFAQSVKSPEEAEYILNRAGDELSPPITFNLIMIKGDEDRAISFGKVHYKKYPEIAVNLSGIYLRRGKRKGAIETAEKALQVLEKKKNDLYDSVLTEHRTALRMFLDKCYIPEDDHKKFIENLVMLLDIEEDIRYYKKLRKYLKTDKEKTAILDRIDGVLKYNSKLLFDIYRIEDEHERLLNLAKENMRYDIFGSFSFQVGKCEPVMVSLSNHDNRCY
ncbi:hypothetical protein BMS3Abin07_00504 [bacterium BMS3Abin07]|nr:hypothetical protein BMS3Abin07_00504 [bacterium BMS3Abin07]GBE32187.1 hypothetical protein BMS3Bbin05_01096 [bacterium BMS3Bbin05]